MKAGTDRPDADSPEIPFLRIQPINQASGEQHTERIHDGEPCRYRAVIRVSPVKFGSDKILPSERQNLPVHVIDSGCKKKHGANDPPVICHPALRVWCTHGYIEFKC
ncbi:hypothetical protein Barb7_03018 [Bacteroidales bacterium Barb7]|nr:hypothetical protein Barb7_03018 [Bacteroidales bacterium Barb7]